MRARMPLLFICSISVFACGGATRVPLLATVGLPVTATPTNAVPLEVVTRGSPSADPLVVEGTSVSFGETEAALGVAVSSAVAPWASEHRARSQSEGDPRYGGWALQVEIIQANAEEKRGRLSVTLGVRATLRSRAGNRYIAQTQTYCTQTGVVEAKDGGQLLYACMTRLGRDLAGWLAGVDP